jgi:hypothetical protein
LIMATGNIESKPVFRARATQIGIEVAVIDALSTAGHASFGSFAFCCSYQPGASSGDETPFVETIKADLGRDATSGEMALLRRLFFESHAVALQDMRSRTERPSESVPTKVMTAERASRYEEQKLRLNGLDLTGPLEPSNALIDMVFGMVETNELRYIQIHLLTSREQEMDGLKEDADLKEYSIRIKAGEFNLKERDIKIHTDLSSDLKVRFALQRRGLAFDQAGLITWSKHDRWVSSLFHRMQELPIKGYAMISLEQVLRADRRLFMKMGEHCRASIVGAPGANKPLDAALDKFSEHTDVLYLVSPLASPFEKSDSSVRSEPYNAVKKNGGGKGDKVGKGKGGGKQQGGKGSGKGEGKGKGKGKGKSKAENKGPPKNCLNRTPDGKQLCWGFNRPGGCDCVDIRPGDKCEHGWHLCGYSGCHEPHAMFDCPAPR